ncbi:hypothetical protein SEVIR_9G466900v4 [Setaria viridis]|uniref:Uncharacterized protein n=2 Tax=Setaria viridis TaxID=4556 RepID=A0A4U6T5H2_SETVI|nr:uncharacterized protein LOC117839459 [Setaria viridis]TKV96997.1 hypothetical protein SEVIR_9G466900v2 [Setaria viridis]TKV96998.1 hypothetical protein SEVIR_9G466900v2 [Setaria viridis]
MGLFGKSTSKQTAKLKTLVKLTATRLAAVRRPRLGRRSIARSDVGQLLSIGHLDRALLRAEQVIEEDNMLEVLDVIELYCKILIEQAAQLENPKECGEEIKDAAAGLMFASARCGELPELLDARAILADKFGRDFAAAAKEGAPGVVDPTLVRKLSGERASLEQKRRLAKEIAAENDILLEFPQNPVEIRQVGRTTSQITNQREKEQSKNVPAREFVQESAAKTDRREVRGTHKPVDGKVNPSLAQLSVDEKVLRESNKYFDARMAAEAAFKSASFAAMAARAAVELSRTESQGKGPRGGGYDKARPVRTTAATEQGTAPPSWRPQKSPSPSPSWSDRSTATSVGSDAAYKGKEVLFDQSDEELEDVVWPPPPQRRPSYSRAASTVGTGVGAGASPWHGDARTRPFQDGVPENNHPQHRRHATEFAGGNARAPALHDALGGGQRGQYVAPPYRRNPAANTGRSSDAGAYESSAYVHPPYARIVSALERSNEHIARHEEVRRIGTDARVLQERVYGAAAPGHGHGPLNPEGRTNSVRTRR